ncbi:MAG: hypothetical protein K2M97_03000, partial [Muribaculaceae bacterium]|nr:hypothetical protein [Muribaculaceae bacterium]
MEEPKPKKKRRCRGWWWKVPLWSVFTLLLLLCAVVGTGLWLLTPQRLTGLVNRYGTEFLHNGSLHANRVELTWRSSFPRMELTIDSLAIRSDEVPDSVATLLAVDRLHGAVNLAHLLKGAITIYDVSITRPQVCIYTDADGLSNLNILPTSADGDSEPESSDIVIPPLKLERFVIEGDAPLRYISEPDSLNIDVTLRLLAVENQDPTYQVSTSILASRLPSVELPDSFAIGFNGNVEWTPDTPLAIGLRKFRIWAGDAAATLNTTIDLNDPLTVNDFSIVTDEISPEYLIDLVRMQPGAEIPALTSDNRLRLSARLLHPYNLADTLLPAVHAAVELTPGRLAVPSMRMRFRNVALKAEVELPDPSDLNSATVKLEKFNLTGDRGATSVALEGNATNLLADPKVEGHLTGNIILHQLPPVLFKELNAQIKGRLYANTGFKFRLSHLNSRQIHRLKLRGMATLTDFSINMPTDTLEAFAGRAELRFGTSQSFVSDRGRADSLLTVSLKIDTAAATISDISAALSGLRCGIGVRNDGTFGDTTTVTPLGGRFIADRLRVASATDSMRAMLRDIDIAARLGRHEGERKTPELNLALTSRSIVYAQNLTRMILRRSEINASMYLTKRRTPTTRRDSTMMARHRHIADSIASSGQDEEETIDFGLDRKSRSLLRRLQLDGTLKARSGRLFTPLYPLRMTMRNLDFHFTADSLMLHGLELQAGQSDFKATGEVTELRRALTSRRNKVPLKIRFNLHADTINVNELTQAAFRGAALAARLDSISGGGYAMSDTIDDDNVIEQSVDSMAVTEIAAILIPSNIDADLRFSANNIVYSNLLMHDFAGTVLINNGGLSLQELRASTEAGSVDLNALYYAP